MFACSRLKLLMIIMFYSYLKPKKKKRLYLDFQNFSLQSLAGHFNKEDEKPSVVVNLTYR